MGWMGMRLRGSGPGPLPRAAWRGVLAMATSLGLVGPAAADRPVTIQIGGPAGVSRLDLGVTYTNHTFQPGGDPGAMRAAETTLRAIGHYQNIRLNGKGTRNPEPSPGQYDWSGLDERLAQVKATGGIPVITLFTAPDWMMGDRASSSQKGSNRTLSPDHYADFVDLVRQVARRYPQVRYYMVWNEMKGFRNRSERRRDNEGYTQFYNLVYDALKQISPSIQVGGPYSPMGFMSNGDGGPISGPYGGVPRLITDSVSYWIANKHGADFICIDGHNRPRDKHPFDDFANLQFYGDTNRWIRSQTPLPIWWSEWYSIPSGGTEDTDAEPARQNALMTATMIEMAPMVSVALRWGPERPAAAPFEQGGQDALWSSTMTSGGGRPEPFAASMQSFERCFKPGSGLLSTKVSDSRVRAMASASCVVVVNTSDRTLDVSVNGKVAHLDPFDVRYIER